MAATGAPTFSARDEPSGSGRSVRPAGSIAQERDVGVRVDADDRRVDLVAVGELHVDLLRALQAVALRRSVTTCAFVAISPSPSRTNPEPAPSCSGSAVEHAPAAEHAEHGHDARRLALVHALRVERPRRARAVVGERPRRAS